MGWFTNVFIYKKAIRKACRLNDVVATVSEYSKQDIANKVGVPLSKIRVVYNGLRTPAEKDPDLQSQLELKFSLQNGFMLNVGGIHERKNIPRLIQAFAKIVSNENYKGNLLITGSASGAPYQEKMRKICDAEVAAAKLEGQVVFTGFISDDELDILLNQASMLIYPSLYEGFGIPILEAMCAGTPVITSNLTAMPEVAGDAGLLVDPLSVDDMAAAMSRLLKDDALRTDLISKGKKRAAGFSWDKNWNEYLALYQELCQA
jgi:glycosyltransferase involved in cell wall biosynthesis